MLFRSHGAYPSTLGYRGFPKSLCSSVNEVICHGIPDSRVVEDGDIVNIDITAFIGGVHGDTNATYLAGDVDEETRLLVERTKESLDRAIKAVRPDYTPVSTVWTQYPEMKWADGKEKDYLVPWTQVTTENADKLLESRK